MIDWLIDRLIDWLIDWSIDWLVGGSFTPYRQYFSHVKAAQWDVWEHLKTEKKNSDFSRLPADLWRNWREKMFRLLYVNRFYHTSQLLVSKYPISKWNLSLRILTRIEIPNIIIEKKLSRSIIQFFSSKFRVGKCFSQFWEK